MKDHLRLGILEGDDIGHEIVPASVAVAKAAAARTGLAIEWVDVPIGRRALEVARAAAGAHRRHDDEDAGGDAEEEPEEPRRPGLLEDDVQEPARQALEGARAVGVRIRRAADQAGRAVRVALEERPGEGHRRRDARLPRRAVQARLTRTTHARPGQPGRSSRVWLERRYTLVSLDWW